MSKRIKDIEELHRFNEAAKDNIIVLVTEYEYDENRTREFLVTRDPKLATTKVPTEAWGNRKEILLMADEDTAVVGSISCSTINDGSIWPPVPWLLYNWWWTGWRIGVVG